MGGVDPLGGSAAAAAPPSKPDPGLVQASQDFAAMLWEDVLHTALPTDTLLGDDSSGAGDIYGGIIEQGFAQAVSRGDNGLAKMVLDSLTRHADGPAPNGPSGSGTP
jgi:hypothetical protein